MLLLSLAALLSSCAAEGNDKKQDLIVKTTQAVPVSHQALPHYFLPVLPKAMIKTRPYCKNNTSCSSFTSG